MSQWDVIIAGGGLAGLGLAQQLITAKPSLRIVILEKNRFPRPEAIAKVGESTVEIGSHYLAKQLGLEQHLQQNHLKKFGIRMFFGGADDLAQQDELGASQSFGLPTYQVDRGIIENQLAKNIQQAGVTLLDGVSIDNIDLAVGANCVSLRTSDGPQQATGKWIVDAAGRASLLKRRLGLASPNAHTAHAIWFRVDKQIIIDDWSSNTAWQQRCSPQGARWLSTNHLMGAGYWLWIIPLASGVTSIGIVMDTQAFEASGIVDEISARHWLQQHQPRCAAEISTAKFLDFVVLRDYSYGCRQLFSADGWALTGEAGVFADPLYSPGSDFIAIGNTLIAQLILADFRAEDVRLRSAVYEKLFASIYQNTLSLYTGQYGGFGDRIMMGLKLLWDYCYYWGVLSLLYFREALPDLDLMRRLAPLLQQAQTLNQKVQQALRMRADKRLELAPRATFMNQYEIPCLRRFHQSLLHSPQIPLQQELSSNTDVLHTVATVVCEMLGENPQREISDEERKVLGNYRDTLKL